MANSSRDEPTDGQLLADAADGDPLAIRRLMDRYDRLVRYTIYRISRERCRRDPLWLDSVASEAWADVCRPASTGQEHRVENMHSYLIQIARRRCIDALRRRREAPLAEGGGDSFDDTQVTAETEDASDILGNIEQLSALRACMGRLDDPERRLCGELAAIMAGRWREAAGRLDLPESTLRSRWKRVLERLRACMEAGHPD